MIIDHPAPGWEDRLRRLWQDTFGDSEAFLDNFFRTAYAHSRCLCAWEADKIVAAVYWFGCTCRNQPIAYIYALAVEEACRGHGIGTKLMERTHTVLEEQGYASVLLVPQEARLQALYARLGYAQGPAIGEWHCRAANQCVPVQQLDALSYAAARRSYLPEDGVVQEGENLRFLQTQARFWAGEDFILAARREENRLIGLEILGNRQAAPHILCALGCTEGTFRTPPPHVYGEPLPQSRETLAPRIYDAEGPQGRGKSIPRRPFAMFRALGPNPAPIPTYFAFAFD